MDLQAFKTHVAYSANILKEWSDSRSRLPSYHYMASVVEDNIIDGLEEYLSEYTSDETGKPHPHYEYITFFSNEALRLLWDVRDEMLGTSDEIMGSPGLNASAKDRVEVAIQSLDVLREKIRRQQRSEGYVELTSDRRQRRDHRSASRR